MVKYIILLSLIVNVSFVKASDNLILGIYEIGQGLDSLPIWKSDAALILISNISDHFSYVDETKKNTLIDSLKSAGIKEIDAGSIAESLNANGFIIIRINRINDMLGATVKVEYLSDSLATKTGTGFANLNLKDINSQKTVFDLSLTFALQRAFAEAYNDSLMFQEAPIEYQTYPWQTMVIGGLEYIDNDVFRKWDVFKDKVVGSYKLVETIFEASYNKSPYIIYDTATRDSIYTIFNMYGIENYDAPTHYEIEALIKLDVKNYLTGQLIRIEDGAEIKLHLCAINKKGLEIIKTEKTIVEFDDIKLVQEKLAEVTKKLLAKDG